jgi:hypothetical protein
MKKYFTLLLLPVLFSCNGVNDKTPPPVEHTPSAADQELIRQLKTKDSVINDLVKSFNELADNMKAIKLKRKSSALNMDGKTSIKVKTEQKKNDDEIIRKLLNSSQQTIASMKEKMEKYGIKNSDLESVVLEQKTEMNKQESEIAALKNQLNDKDAKIDALTSNLTKTERESAVKTEVMNSGYCIIGTKEVLLKQGVLAQKSGKSGLSRIEELGPDFTKHGFSIIDMYKTTVISVAANKLKILTSQPKSSYTITDTQEYIKKLTITNPTLFWSVSKYLVIEVSTDAPSDPTNQISL